MSRPIEVATEAAGCDRVERLLRRIGDRVRTRRSALGLSRRALAEKSAVSQRYLALLEAGDGNVSIALLARIADALGSSLEALIAETPLPGRARRIALIGLRGAGKSTLGRLAAVRLGMPFVEVNTAIAEMAGMAAAELIALTGQEGYRHFEREALERIAREQASAVVAVAGGIVEEPETFDFLLARFHTIWIKAAPQEHMARVRGQGDERPMAGNPDALKELRRILAGREALYSRAKAMVDTSGATPAESLADVLAVIDEHGFLD